MVVEPVGRHRLDVGRVSDRVGPGERPGRVEPDLDLLGRGVVVHRIERDTEHHPVDRLTAEAGTERIVADRTRSTGRCPARREGPRRCGRRTPLREEPSRRRELGRRERRRPPHDRHHERRDGGQADQDADHGHRTMPVAVASPAHQQAHHQQRDPSQRHEPEEHRGQLLGAGQVHLRPDHLGLREHGTDRSNSAPGRIRTCDRRIRSPMLYPAELRRPRVHGTGWAGAGCRSVIRFGTSRRLVYDPRFAWWP